MAWAVPQFPKNQVDKAGLFLVNEKKTTSHRRLEDVLRSYEIVDNWRSSHSYPLNTFQNTLRNRAKSVDSDFLVAQRIKRHESIKAKLSRQTTQLSQMQDIGGCRVILSSLEKAKAVRDVYQSSRFGHILKGAKDYVDAPKPDGYRGYHLIYRYVGNANTVAWTDLHIEVQVRSALQHAWATAVEAVGLFTKQALKSNQGTADWLRFFALMGTVIADREGTEIVPNMPSDRRDLILELEDIEQKVSAAHLLQAYNVALNFGGAADHAKYFLMHLNLADLKVRIGRYKASESQRANADYTEIERASAFDPNQQIVLVSADSIAALKRAYPNYFLDTERFAGLVRDALGPSIAT